MNKLQFTLSACGLVLAIAASPLATAQVHSPDPAAPVHYVFDPIPLLPGEDIQVCTVDTRKIAQAERDGRWQRHMPAAVQTELRLFDPQGALLATYAQHIGMDSMGTCFDVAGAALGHPGAAPSQAVMAHLMVMAPEGASVDISPTLTVLDPATGATRAHALPAVQTREPLQPRQWSAYRPQFDFRMAAVTGADHAMVIGPVQVDARQTLNVCAADAGPLPSEQLTLNYTKIEWNAAVYAAPTGAHQPTRELVLREFDMADGCTDIVLQDFVDVQPGGADPAPMVLTVLLRAHAPEPTPFVPVGMGRLTTVDPVEPAILIGLLLPAIQK